MEDFLQLHLGLLAGTGPSHTSDASDQEKNEEKMVEFRHHDHPTKIFFLFYSSLTQFWKINAYFNPFPQLDVRQKHKKFISFPLSVSQLAAF